jgi:hypothetical protein
MSFVAAAIPQKSYSCRFTLTTFCDCVPLLPAHWTLLIYARLHFRINIPTISIAVIIVVLGAAAGVDDRVADLTYIANIYIVVYAHVFLFSYLCLSLL